MPGGLCTIYQTQQKHKRVTRETICISHNQTNHILNPINTLITYLYPKTPLWNPYQYFTTRLAGALLP